MIQICNNCEIMCLNMYMPCDGMSEDDTFAEYMDVLGEIQQVIHSYSPEYIIYGEDMTTDLTRSTPQAHALRNFILDLYA